MGAYLFINILDTERTDLKYIVKCQVHNIFAEKENQLLRNFKICWYIFSGNTMFKLHLSMLFQPCVP